MSIVLSVAKIENTPTITIAALVTTPAEQVMPSAPRPGWAGRAGPPRGSG